MKLDRLVTLCGTGLVLFTGACGDDAGTTTSTSSAGGGGTGGSGTTTGTGGAGGGAQTFEGIVIDGLAGMPLVGAGVALDLSDGSRVEGVSSATGEVTLSYPAGTTWTSVITHKDGYNFAVYPSALMFQPPLEMFINPDVDTSGYVQISGTATNMDDATNDYLTAFFQADMANPIVFEEKGVTTYQLLVPPSTDFTFLLADTRLTLTGQDFTRVFHSFQVTQQTGITTATTLNADFATTDAPTGNFTTSLAVPPDATLAASGVGLINVVSDNGFLGGSTACTHDAANSEFDCTGSLYANGATANRTFYAVGDANAFNGNPGRLVNANTAGGPGTGLIDPDFTNPPTVTAPAGAGPHPVDTAMAYTVAAGGGTYDFTLYNLTSETDGRFIGFGFLPPDTFTIPALPSTSDSAGHFETAMRAAAFTCRVTANQCVAFGVQEWAASPPAN